MDNGGDGIGIAEGATVKVHECVVARNGEAGLQMYHPDSRLHITKTRVRENHGAAICLGEGATKYQIDAPPKQQRILGLIVDDD